MLPGQHVAASWEEQIRSERWRKKVSLVAVGDVCPNRDAPESIFALAAPVLREADITFGQLETNFSERGTRNFVSRSPLRAHPRNVKALRDGLR